VTTCDSFRPSKSSEDFELGIFDQEPAVLLGVNEGIPKFSEFTELLRQHAGAVQVDLYTHTLYNAPQGGTLTDLTQWRFPKDLAMLAKRSGSVAMRVTLKQPWPLPGRIQNHPALAAGEYVDWLLSSISAIAKLAPLLPNKYVDLPFPGTRGSKFEMLNGWRLRVPRHGGRRAYRRGRWFLRRPASADILQFEVTLPGRVGNDCSLEMLLDGVPIGTYPLTAGLTQKVAVDVSTIPIGHVFAVELRRQDDVSALEEGGFDVYRRKFVTAQPHLQAYTSGKEQMVGQPKVFAIIPVFNRLHFTQACIKVLQAQTYQPIEIIVSDGGSTDGTVEVLRRDYPEVSVLTTDTELWWAGSMAAGINHALARSQNPDDYLLMMNNDTEIPADYVATLVDTAQTHDAAVGALIVDSRDPDHILDAGEYIDWESYSFPVKNTIAANEFFCDDVDVLPGRGSLIPLSMIQSAGNVNEQQWPHYLADYEFFYRLNQHGFSLVVCYETYLLAHIEETGLLPGVGTKGFRAIWQELFSRRSMTNVVDHWRFVQRYAPHQFRLPILLRLSRRVVGDLTLRTPSRPIFLPIYWLYRAAQEFTAQVKLSMQFFRDVRRNGTDMFCYPHQIPKLIRIPMYLFVCPGPVSSHDCIDLGIDIEALLGQNVVRQTSVEGWYWLNRLKVSPGNDSKDFKKLRLISLNPFKKITNILTWNQLIRQGRES
jgi:GT2 family glycosyltransferase